MKELVWDNELEAIAQRWTEQCVGGHDSNRRKLDGTGVGQNGYSWGGGGTGVPAGVEPVQEAVRAWFSEVDDPGFRHNPGSTFSALHVQGTGHYTQVVWADTEQVGCGKVVFRDGDWTKLHVMCNYAVAGNLIGGQM